jgi:hypothetical protein
MLKSTTRMKEIRHPLMATSHPNLIAQLTLTILRMFGLATLLTQRDTIVSLDMRIAATALALAIVMGPEPLTLSAGIVDRDLEQLGPVGCIGGEGETGEAATGYLGGHQHLDGFVAAVCPAHS